MSMSGIHNFPNFLMSTEVVPSPPEIYQQFVKRYPKLEKAWEQLSEAGREGPLDDKTLRLIKLGIAIGAMREGEIRANVRKAVALGISKDEIEQVIALAAATLGMSATVAVFSWVENELAKKA
ncbi:MAG TPA: carboxymuconolactone decarboxylase family protein [Cyanobacteria bacterium UBA11149]|nr:carboxymuconolactone decarboxylase family protein [Cyanobacteria bacterium UBA11367]HBE57588.1 carboxymuconolactone decarboxylase family protein [Cyanobacteria bacterium UBA11366]HBK62545.1 carboxymuconolactone decarboxylase family protein [Cyanobacteria bacterium UBA11166]HBR77060.1 carboxymuconolactone decarboxylase family protein [Cyanobacteria bacterium UBA11159]HBS72003.1 carboxymuconolactone decarboxylase family protein [Cyanobacteria bacterium UBA11153]HBW89394.1 carboxymuconolactone